MIVSEFTQKHIGEPYTKYDCWGIIKLFYIEVLEIDISLGLDYGKPGADKAYREKISKVVEMQKCKFEEVKTPSFGDIILINISGTAAHVGVYLGENKFLHSIRETGCIVESLTRWTKHIRGYYRWPK